LTNKTIEHQLKRFRNGGVFCFGRAGVTENLGLISSYQRRRAVRCIFWAAPQKDAASITHAIDNLFSKVLITFASQ
jgi:hypothetical protein